MVTRFQPSLPIRIVRVLFVVVAFALGIEMLRRALPTYLPRDWANAWEYDSLADWRAAQLFPRGMSPFTPEGLAAIGHTSMPHPPTAAFWYLPLVDADKSAVAQLTALLLLLFLPVHTYLCSRELKYPVPLATAFLTTCAVITTAWFHYHFDVSQYSEPIAFAYVLAWWLLRRRRDVTAGICLGAALTLKLFPGVMVVMLLVARRFRAMFVAVATWLVIAAIMTRADGWKSWLEFFKQQKVISYDWLGVLQNSSLLGLVTRVMHPYCRVGLGHPTVKETLFSSLCSLALLGAAIWFSRAHLKEAREGDPRAIDLPFALFGLLSVFMNAWAWEHYFVLTIQPLFILLAFFCTAWRTTINGWSQHDASNGRLFFVSVAALGGVSGVLLTVRALGVNWHERDELSNLWFKYHDPFYHHQMHLLEAANFVPWIVPIVISFLALSLSRRLKTAD